MPKNAVAVLHLPDEYRTAIYTDMLKTDYQARYWQCVLRSHIKWDKRLKFFLLCTTGSGTVSILKHNAFLWGILSVASTFLAAAQNILFDKHDVETLIHVHTEFAHISVDYENLWNDRQITPPADIIAKYKTVKARETALEKDTAKFRRNLGFRIDCQREVQVARNLPQSAVPYPSFIVLLWRIINA